MKKTMYMMRHGQTLFNVRKKIQGACDSPLTEKGIEQAQRAKEILDEKHIESAYCSTSERCSDTLEIIIGDKSYTRLKGLKEMNFGVYEGESEDLNPRWENGYDEVFPKSGGESRADVSKRVYETCLSLMEKEEHKNILVVSHGGACFHFLRAFVPMKQLREEHKKGFPNCCILEIEFDDGKFELLNVYRPN